MRRCGHFNAILLLSLLNDYGGEGSGRKSDAVYALVKGLLQRGVPISGVGLQMHLSLTTYPTPQDVLANMNRLAALGLEVQITEMDVEIQGAQRWQKSSPGKHNSTGKCSVYASLLQTAKPS